MEAIFHIHRFSFGFTGTWLMITTGGATWIDRYRRGTPPGAEPVKAPSVLIVLEKMHDRCALARNAYGSGSWGPPGSEF